MLLAQAHTTITYISNPISYTFGQCTMIISKVKGESESLWAFSEFSNTLCGTIFPLPGVQDYTETLFAYQEYNGYTCAVTAKVGKRASPRNTKLSIT